MMKRFRDKYFDKQTTSWASHFHFIQKLISFIGFSSYNQSYFTKVNRFLASGIIVLVPICSFWAIFREPDLSNTTFDAVFSLLASIHAMLKVLCLIFITTKREELSNIVINITSSLNTGHRFCQEFGREYRILSIKIMAGNFILYSCCATAYVISPLFYFHEWKLPLYAPLIGTSHQNHPGYEMNYIFILFHVFCAAVASIGIDCSFYLFGLFIASRFDICIRYCALIGDKTTDFNTEDKQKELLINLLKIHSDVIDFSNRFTKAYENFMLGGVLTFMGLTGLCIVQILLNSQVTAYFGIILIWAQLLLYSIFGEMILSKSEEFTQAIYCSNWYDLNDIENRKIILVMLLNAQKNGGFSLRGFPKLSLRTYTEVLKACYTFTACLIKIL